MRYRHIFIGLEIAATSRSGLAQPASMTATPARELAPVLGLFLVAHEEAHERLRHTRDTVFAAGDTTARALRLRVLELEADCAAAKELATQAPAVLQVAILWFRGEGNTPATGEHPSGIDRSLTLTRCTPGAQRPTFLAGIGRARTHAG